MPIASCKECHSIIKKDKAGNIVCEDGHAFPMCGWFYCHPCLKFVSLEDYSKHNSDPEHRLNVTDYVGGSNG